jgi:hypothetical protein
MLDDVAGRVRGAGVRRQTDAIERCSERQA